MMFSKACEYAIKSMVYIAEYSKEGQCVGVKEVAGGIKGPMTFVAKILQDLNKKDFVVSVKGPHGGFYMTDRQKNVPIIKIVNEFDGMGLLSNCVLGLSECSDKNPCPMHKDFQKIKEILNTSLRKSTIADFKDLMTRQAAVLKVE